MKKTSILFALAGVAAVAPPVLAEPSLVINYNTSAFENLILQNGDISVTVSYTPRIPGQVAENNLRYELFYQGQSQQSIEASAYNHAEFRVQDLDNDDMPEVVVQDFSGGAHCCTNHVVYRWQPDSEDFTALETGYRDGLGGEFRDLDGDGYSEFMTVDNAFLYRFSSYAGSYPPQQIFTYREGTLTETTRSFPELLQSGADDMREAFDQLRQREDRYGNGILAGYVAQSSLLGPEAYEMAWQFMLEHYDGEEPWGLGIRDEAGEIVDQHSDFPTALRAFLIETGYLDESGQLMGAENE